VKKRAKKRRLTVCLLSHHPVVLGEFQRVLAPPGFHVVPKQLDSTLAPDLRRVVVPRASVYVVDAHAARPATESLITNILEQYPDARLLVVADKFSEANSYTLLRLGAKGLLTYTEAHDQLPLALPLVAAGGFWVPRALLSGFVDSILSSASGRRLRGDTATALSRREQEVLDGLLENLANKEIANKLNISERTVKFHVSNLLNKFGVRRRADLILLCYQRQRPLA
jgi:DNA-binding NarL/FixJ family response regulator